MLLAIVACSSELIKRLVSEPCSHVTAVMECTVTAFVFATCARPHRNIQNVIRIQVEEQVSVLLQPPLEQPKSRLYRVKQWAIWRQEDKSSSTLVNGVLQLWVGVNLSVVHDANRTRPWSWITPWDNVLHKRVVKLRSCKRAFSPIPREEPMHVNCCENREALSTAKWYLDNCWCVPLRLAVRTLSMSAIFCRFIENDKLLSEREDREKLRAVHFKFSR
jgi:hypothetical protein